jgi:hypothetical protein
MVVPIVCLLLAYGVVVLLTGAPPGGPHDRGLTTKPPGVREWFAQLWGPLHLKAYLLEPPAASQMRLEPAGPAACQAVARVPVGTPV